MAELANRTQTCKAFAPVVSALAPDVLRVRLYDRDHQTGDPILENERASVLVGLENGLPVLSPPYKLPIFREGEVQYPATAIIEGIIMPACRRYFDKTRPPNYRLFD